MPEPLTRSAGGTRQASRQRGLFAQRVVRRGRRWRPLGSALQGRSAYHVRKGVEKGWITSRRSTELDGLGALVDSPGLRIEGNDKLTSLASLASLTSADYLSINGNSALVDLDGLQDLATLKGLQVNDNFALVAVDALVPGAGGSLKTVSDTVHVVGNLALPACAARKIHDALLKPPNYFCYIPNEPDACNEDPDICKPLEPP